MVILHKNGPEITGIALQQPHTVFNQKCENEKRYKQVLIW